MNGLKGLLAYSWWLTLAGLLPLVWLLVATFVAVQGGEGVGQLPEDENPFGDSKALESDRDTAGSVRNVLVTQLLASPPAFQEISNKKQTENLPEGVRSLLSGQEQLRVSGHLVWLMLEGAGGVWGEEKRRRLVRFIDDAISYKDTVASVGESIRLATSLRKAVDAWIKSRTEFEKVKEEWNSENYSVAEGLADKGIKVVGKLQRQIESIDVPEYKRLIEELDTRTKALVNYGKSSKFQFRIQGWRRMWTQSYPKVVDDEDALVKLRTNTYRRLTIRVTTDEPGLLQGQRLDQQLTAQRYEWQKLTERQQTLDADVKRLRDGTRAVVTAFPVPPTVVPPTEKVDRDSHKDLIEKLEQVKKRVKEIGEGNTGWNEKLARRDFARKQWVEFQIADRKGVEPELLAIAGLLKTCPEAGYPTAMIRERLQCHVIYWLKVGLFKKKPQPRFPELQEVKLRNSAGWRYGKFERFRQVAEVVEYKFFELLPGTLTVSEEPRVLKSFQFASPEPAAQSRFPRRVLTSDLIDRYNDALGKAVLKFDDPAAWKAFAGVCRDADEVLVAYLKDVGDDKNRLPSAVDFSREVRDSKALVERWNALDGLFSKQKQKQK